MNKTYRVRIIDRISRKVSLVIVILLCLSVIMSASYTSAQTDTGSTDTTVRPPLNDIDSHWAKDYINNLYNKYIINGYPDGSFRPDKSITRAEMAVILTNASGIVPDTNPVLKFTDSADIGSWAAGSISKLSDMKIINGYPDGSFLPNKEILRSEIAVLLIKLLGVDINPSARTNFADDDLIPDWASGYIEKATELNIINGNLIDGKYYFKPSDPAKRAEVCVMVSRMLNVQPTPSVTPTPVQTQVQTPTPTPTAGPDITPTPTPASGGVQVWVSKVNGTDSGMDLGLVRQQDVYFADDTGSRTMTFTVNPDITYQEMDGFGASFTDASSWLVEKKLTEENRDKLMNDLFDKDSGIGISMLRQPIGAPDFAVAPFNYDPSQDTDDLPNFSIAHDEDYIIPSIKQAMSINPGRIKVMCATWSPPGWMKTYDTELGFVNNNVNILANYTAYANYLTKFIMAYQSAGIPIYATTIQNEPDNGTSIWPSMAMSSAEETDLVNNYLYPAFQKNNLTGVKIIGWDHNYNTPNYPNGQFAMDILGNDTNNYFAGTAWHWYSGGESEVLNSVHAAYPDKGIWFTEGSGGSWNSVRLWQEAFNTDMVNIIRLSRDWSKSVIWWNVALDENNGPDYYYMANTGAHSTCRGLVQINQQTGNITYYPDYYTLGHISKFVDPGAYRIDSNSYEGVVESVAFKNPDNSKVVIVYNSTTSNRSIVIKCGTKSFKYLMLAGEAVTFKWDIAQ